MLVVLYFCTLLLHQISLLPDAGGYLFKAMGAEVALVRNGCTFIILLFLV